MSRIDESIRSPVKTRDPRGTAMVVCAAFFGIGAVAAAVLPGGPSAGTAVELQVPDPIRELGVVQVGEIVAETFDLRNPSSRDALLINEVRPGCGCTVPRMASNDIPAAGSVPLQIYFRVPDEPGATRKSISVRYQQLGRTDIREIRLQLRATVARAIDVTPDRLLFESPAGVAAGDEVVRSCELRLHPDLKSVEGTGPPLRIADVKATHPAFRTELHTTAEGWRVEVRFDPAAWPPDRRAAYLLVQTVRDGQSPRSIEVPLVVVHPRKGDSK